MNSLRLVLLGICTSFAFCTHAQKENFAWGVVLYDESDTYKIRPRESDITTKEFNYGAGLTGFYELSDQWTLEAGVTYIHRTYRATQPFDHCYDTDRTCLEILVHTHERIHHLVEIPLGIKYTHEPLFGIKKLKPFLYAGTNLKFFIRGQYETNWNSPREYDFYQYFGSSLDLGPGLEWEFLPGYVATAKPVVRIMDLERGEETLFEDSGHFDIQFIDFWGVYLGIRFKQKKALR